MSELLYKEIGEKLTETHQSTTGQMFGKPCLKVNNKAYAAFFKGCMIFKLGQKEVNSLKEKYVGSENWDPSGKKRPMKDWIQVPEAYSSDWGKLANQALEFVEVAQK